jgi:hypothetical protein
MPYITPEMITKVTKDIIVISKAFIKMALVFSSESTRNPKMEIASESK